MRCVRCEKGQTAYGKVTVTMKDDPYTVIINNVPSEVCNNCGEYYLDDPIIDELTQMADDAVLKGKEETVIEYAA